MADRDHNLETLEYLSAQRQNRFIKETIEVYKKVFKQAATRYPFAYQVLSERINLSIAIAARKLEASGKLNPEVKALIVDTINDPNQE